MGTLINERLRALLNDPESIKVLATTDPDGTPHVVFKGSIREGENGFIKYWELIETSRSQRNMVNSIWFGKKVAINVRRGSESYEIIGEPYRAIISGREFEKEYKLARERGDLDLSTVWLIRPLEVRNETFESRYETEDASHPILRHLDRLTV